MPGRGGAWGPRGPPSLTPGPRRTGAQRTPAEGGRELAGSLQAPVHPHIHRRTGSLMPTAFLAQRSCFSAFGSLPLAWSLQGCFGFCFFSIFFFMPLIELMTRKYVAW